MPPKNVLKGNVPFNPFDKSLADPRRSLLLDLYHLALAAVDGRRRMRVALAADRGNDPVSAFAVGKAAASMMLGAADTLGSRLERGLVVAPEGAIPAELAARPGFRCLEAGHPRPDERSLEAGRALADFAAGTPETSRVLLLVSGGASALLEIPAPGIGLAELRALYDRSLTETFDIESLNARRTALSLIKGGRLPGMFRGASVEAFMISDVPRDDPAVLGSGLLAAPGLRPRLVGSLDDALDAVLRGAEARGLKAHRAVDRLQGDAESAAHRICRELAASGSELQVHGGETVVRLPAHPGRGGRCQHLAVAAARCIAGHSEYLLLAAGSDGQDGASGDAGAIVDGETVERAADCGLDPAAVLKAADSGRLLEATGDLVYTGPTGTNVGDIVLALRLQPANSSPM
jgi:hydroxypyruvate reductase